MRYFYLFLSPKRGKDHLSIQSMGDDWNDFIAGKTSVAEWSRHGGCHG